MKRTFIAINIPLTSSALEFVDTLKEILKDEKIRWVKTYNMHITLFFMGDTNENDIDAISNKLSYTLRDNNSFELTIKGIGIFKSVYSPTALWMGIKSSEELYKIKQSIDNMLVTFGFPAQQKDFKPHLTLGRMKSIKNKGGLKSLLDKYANINIQKSILNEIIFYESHLTPEGPIYEVIKKVVLG